MRRYLWLWMREDQLTVVEVQSSSLNHAKPNTDQPISGFWGGRSSRVEGPQLRLPLRRLRVPPRLCALNRRAAQLQPFIAKLIIPEKYLTSAAQHHNLSTPGRTIFAPRSTSPIETDNSTSDCNCCSDTIKPIMSFRPSSRFFANFSRNAFFFRQPLLRRRIQTAAGETAEAQTKFQRFWNSEVGPKTVHFW